MMSAPIRLAALALFLAPPFLAEAQTLDELNEFWAEMSRTVETGDSPGYSRLYHPDAVLVELGSMASYPIEAAMPAWQEAQRATREGEAETSVTFRFTQRLHDETTAHETGIFRYTRTPRGGVTSVAMIHFEALLLRKDGEWMILMEYQKQPASAVEWDSAGR